MTEEQAAELRYEAGMYQSLYEVAKARIEVLEAALREIETTCMDATSSGHTNTIGAIDIARAALGKDAGK